MIARFCPRPGRLADCSHGLGQRLDGDVRLHRAVSRRHDAQPQGDLCGEAQGCAATTRSTCSGASSQPTGCWIAFMGPDGCGKSLVINAVGSEFAPSFRTSPLLSPAAAPYRPQTVEPWPGDRSARAATARRSRFRRESDRSVARLRAGLPGPNPARRSSAPSWFCSIAVSTICWSTASASATAVRPGCCAPRPGWPPAPTWSFFWTPRPRCCDRASRKCPPAEVARQRAAYLELARTLPSAVVVNAAQLPEDVIHDALAAIMDHLGRRTKKRPAHSDSSGRQARNGHGKSARPPHACARPEHRISRHGTGSAEKLRDVAGPRDPAGPVNRAGSSSATPAMRRRCFEAGARSRSAPDYAGARWSRPRRWGCCPGFRASSPSRAPIDSSYWRRSIPGFQDDWVPVLYIGNASHTRKITIFFVGHAGKAGSKRWPKSRFILCSGQAILSEAAILEKLQGADYLPAPLFHDPERGIAAQSWLEGEPVSRKLTPAHMDLLAQLCSFPGPPSGSRRSALHRPRTGPDRSALRSRCAQPGAGIPGLR